MCYMFNCVSYVVDVLQRLLQFVLGMVICIVISVALLLAIGVGIAYGYNYSLVEYISIKEPYQTLYLKRNNKETDLPILKQMNDFYKSSMSKFLRINYNSNNRFDSAEKLDSTYRPLTSKFRTHQTETREKKYKITKINPKKTTLDFLLQIINQETQRTNKPQKIKRGNIPEERHHSDYDENDLIVLHTFQPVDVFDGTPMSVLTRTRRRYRSTAWTFDPEW